MDNNVRTNLYPSLELDKWEKTKKTLHLFIQIIGKIRLALYPKSNHWWHVPLFVSVRGLTTRPIPYGDTIFEIEFDFIHHVLSIRSSHGHHELIKIDNASVSEFYKSVFATLDSLGINVDINDLPYDNESTLPFSENLIDYHYNAEYVNRFWKVLVLVNSVFEKFRAKYTGKSTPVQLYWHHLDLVVTRFSGNKAPEREWPTNVEREAYSHEVISFGFWAGDENIREPAFYAYMYPEPDGLECQKIKPDEAIWNTDPGYAMALLPYEAVRLSASPEAEIMEFLESVYSAGCGISDWNSSEFEMPD